MGRLVRVRSFTRVVRNGAKSSDVKVDPGGGANVTLDHFSAPGDDSFPLPDDTAAAISVEGSGREAAVGYADTVNDPKATAGEKRIYARDPDTGAVVVDVWLKSDGSATTENENGSALLAADGGSTLTTPLSTFTAAADGSIAGVNGNGDFELQAGGDFTVNGVTIKANGDVIMPNGLLLAGKEINGHSHAQGNDSANDVQVNVGPNL